MMKISMPEFNKKVGHRIRLRRKTLKLTQKNIADILGVSVQQAQNFESGKSSPKMYYLYKIARILSTDINYFFQDIQEDNSNNIDGKISELSLRLQNLSVNFMNIKDKKVALKIEQLITSISKE